MAAPSLHHTGRGCSSRPCCLQCRMRCTVGCSAECYAPEDCAIHASTANCCCRRLQPSTGPSAAWPEGGQAAADTRHFRRSYLRPSSSITVILDLGRNFSSARLPTGGEWQGMAHERHSEGGERAPATAPRVSTAVQPSRSPAGPLTLHTVGAVAAGGLGPREERESSGEQGRQAATRVGEQARQAGQVVGDGKAWQTAVCQQVANQAASASRLAEDDHLQAVSRTKVETDQCSVWERPSDAPHHPQQQAGQRGGAA